MASGGPTMAWRLGAAASRVPADAGHDSGGSHRAYRATRRREGRDAFREPADPMAEKTHCISYRFVLSFSMFAVVTRARTLPEALDPI